jgi:hypothetical protein
MSDLVATGVHGLDDILAGGLTQGCLYPAGRETWLGKDDDCTAVSA